MRATVVLAALASVAVAEWSYTGPSYTMTADVWTSSCTDDTAAPTWTTYTSAAPPSVSSAAAGWSGAHSWASSPAAVSASSAAGWGSSYEAPGSSYATPAPTSAAPVASYSSAVSVPAATYTGAANQRVVGAGVVAVAGLAMLL